MISPAMHGQQRSFLVCLPPSYNTPQGQTQHYPVLYLLHGSPGKDSGWLIAGKADQIEESLIAQKRIQNSFWFYPMGMDVEERRANGAIALMDNSVWRHLSPTIWSATLT
ncbi:MAG: hypothetical protein NVS4B11_31860 [Ktedonobacteraceae bacterium]